MKNRLLIVMAIVFSLHDCSWIRGWGDKELEPGDPVPLREFSPTLATHKEWSAKIGDGIGRQRTQLRPAYSSGTIYAADHKGLLVALDAQSGNRRWPVKTGLPFSGGRMITPPLQNGRLHNRHRLPWLFPTIPVSNWFALRIVCEKSPLRNSCPVEPVETGSTENRNWSHSCQPKQTEVLIVRLDNRIDTPRN